MNVSKVMKPLMLFAQFIKIHAARMVTAPGAGPAQVETVEDVCLPLGQIRELVKPVFWVSIFITETFRTKEWPNEIVAKLCHIALYGQKPQAFIVREVNHRMASP